MGLTSFNQANASVGDTYNGFEITSALGYRSVPGGTSVNPAATPDASTGNKSQLIIAIS